MPRYTVGSEKKDSKDRDVSMLDQTLSYAHRPGRIDITVHRHGDGSAISNSDTLSGQNGGAGSGPFHTPIYMHSYCKVMMTYSVLWCMSGVLFYSIVFVIHVVLFVSFLETHAWTWWQSLQKYQKLYREFNVTVNRLPHGVITAFKCLLTYTVKSALKSQKQRLKLSFFISPSPPFSLSPLLLILGVW